MERNERIEQCAALLDGEIRDTTQLEQLGELLKADGVLRAEFEQQRELKLLLGSLPEAQPSEREPQFLQTRVLSEIAARRKANRGLRFKLAGAAAGGFALCLAAVGFIGQYFAIGASLTPVMARNNSSTLTQPGVWMATDKLYTSPEWEVTLPKDATPEMKNFLEFASQAHGYSKMRHSADEMTPNMAEAIQVLDTGSGN
jgi:hypothetical protein